MKSCSNDSFLTQVSSSFLPAIVWVAPDSSREFKNICREPGNGKFKGKRLAFPVGNKTRSWASYNLYGLE
jgi:hypothetical protein